MSNDVAPVRRSTGFLIVCAVGYAGGVIAYLPLLSFLLPMRIQALDAATRIEVLTAGIVAGALAASVSNIVFGILSDRSLARGGGRRRWVAGGAVATMAAHAPVAMATSPLALVGAVAVFQIAVNALLAPLLAILADEVPDARKGTAGAMLSFGAPVASGVAALSLAMPEMAEAGRLAIVLTAMGLCLMPLLLTPSRMTGEAPARQPMMARRDLWIAWGARLMVQVSGNAVSLYLLYYFESVAGGLPMRLLGVRVGHLLTGSLLVSIPITLALGRLSDRTGARRPLLVATGLLAALGLAGMGVAREWTMAAAAFALYASALAAFLALHAGYAMLLLPSPGHRGRDLGLLNLTNTLPALLGPLLTWALATPEDFGRVMPMLAALTATGAVAMLAVRRDGR